MPAVRRRHLVPLFIGSLLLGLLAALCVLASGASAAGSRCAGASDSVAHTPRPVLQRAVVCLINHERREYGLPALHASRHLDRSAQGWTHTMVAHALFSHGTDFAARITASGFRWSAVGENVATGFPTPAKVVAGWMHSPGHCANILSSVFREVGTGVSGRLAGAGTGAGTWAQDFGLSMGQRPDGHADVSARVCMAR